MRATLSAGPHHSEGRPLEGLSPLIWLTFTSFSLGRGVLPGVPTMMVLPFGCILSDRGCAGLLSSEYELVSPYLMNFAINNNHPFA